MTNNAPSEFKLALVTGGMKRMGAVIAARLATEGWSLALHGSHSLEPDHMLAKVLSDAHTHWHGFHADFSDSHDVAQLLPAITDHFGQPPCLIVNNASLFSDDDAATLTDETLMSHLAVNMAAPVLLATQLGQILADDAQGCVVNILDQRIAQPHRDQLSYTLSKQALSEATRTLARALAPKLRVNAVAPGLTLATPDYGTDQMTRLAELMPLEALSTPNQIADTVVWLAEAKAVTGQVIFVDGGAHMVSFERDFIHLARDPTL